MYETNCHSPASDHWLWCYPAEHQECPILKESHSRSSLLEWSLKVVNLFIHSSRNTFISQFGPILSWQALLCIIKLKKEHGDKCLSLLPPYHHIISNPYFHRHVSSTKSRWLFTFTEMFHHFSSIFIQQWQTSDESSQADDTDHSSDPFRNAMHLNCTAIEFN